MAESSRPASVSVSVRWFAAARAAAGVDGETVTLPAGSCVAQLLDALAARGGDLPRVLAGCSLLLDGLAVRTTSTPLRSSAQVDVLPPFAGG